MIALALLAFAPGVTVARAQAAGETGPRVVTLDWNLTETLIAMGIPPVGAAGVDAYREWVGGAVPRTVIRLGLRTQPNLELLSQLAPERILASSRFAALEPRLARIAPVSVVAIYASGGPLWPHMISATRKVAALVSRPDAGERLIRDVEENLAALKRRLPNDVPPLLVVQLADARHVRIFGPASLYGAVLHQLGLRSAWRGQTNAWGYSLVGLGALMNDARVRANARMVVVDPLPPGLGHRLPDSSLWQRLKIVRRGDVIRLPPVWSIGGLPSAQRFARLLAQALTAQGRTRSDTASQQKIPDA